MVLGTLGVAPSNMICTLPSTCPIVSLSVLASLKITSIATASLQMMCETF